MKSLSEVINEDLDGSVVLTVLDKKTAKTFADKQQEVKFKGAAPQYLVYKIKDGKSYLFYATKKGMVEYLQTSLEEDGKQLSKKVMQVKVGESMKTPDGAIWIRIEK